MKDKGLFIVAYGIDGVGKSELVEGLTKKIQMLGFDCLNFEDYKKKSQLDNPYSALKKQIEINGTPMQEFLNFINSTIQQSNEIKKILDTGTSVIKDRYLDDVVAHATWKGVVNAGKIEKNILHSILQPDYSCLLTVDEVVRRIRIDNRGIVDEYDTIKKIPGTRLYHFENYFRKKIYEKEKLGTGIILDTTKLSVNEVSDKILNFILSGSKDE